MLEQVTFEFNTSHWFARDTRTGKFAAVGATFKEVTKKLDVTRRENWSKKVKAERLKAKLVPVREASREGLYITQELRLDHKSERGTWIVIGGYKVPWTATNTLDGRTINSPSSIGIYCLIKSGHWTHV